MMSLEGRSKRNATARAAGCASAGKHLDKRGKRHLILSGMLLRSRPHRRFPFALLPAALVCLSICGIAIPSHVSAQGTDFFRCTDRQGNVTITNRHYDPRVYTCTPFTNLNAAFRRAEAERRVSRPEPAGRVEAGGISTAESARISAEAARTSMEAAQTAAEAAYITAQAVERVLARNYFFIIPW